jgi:hypothetical protein
MARRRGVGGRSQALGRNASLQAEAELKAAGKVRADHLGRAEIREGKQ